MTALKDLTGQQFGDFKVISRAPNRITPKGQAMRVWHCQCVHCGLKKEILGTTLKQKKNICRCSKKPKIVKIAKRDRSSFILANKYPNLAMEWDAKKNGVPANHAVITSISKMYWWITPYDDPRTKKHFDFSWQATIRQKVNKRVCPYIADRKVYFGFNDLATLYPNLLKEWDYEKNTISPQSILWKSSQKAWWICSLGHSYDTRICHRTDPTKPSSCPYCSVPARKILIGFNDLKTTNPEILLEWDYQKNKVKPTEISKGYSRKVWWKCQKGHSYKQSVPYRIKKFTEGHEETCPYCSHQKLLKGFNDFATEHPELLKEWDYKKNKIQPDEVMSCSHQKVWWKCPFGHSYNTYLYNRTGNIHSKCPICDKENHTSFPEQAIYYYVKKIYKDTRNSDQDTIGMELDIYIPSIKTAIEYDGRHWHDKSKTDEQKNQLCLQNHIRLIRIREKGLKFYTDCENIVRTGQSVASLEKCIYDILKKISKNVSLSVDLNRDEAAILESYISKRKNNSLAEKYPKLAKEWDIKRNGDLTADMVSYGSLKEGWWKGICGHEFKMRVYSRTKLHCGCPYCAGKKVKPGFNDFRTWCLNNSREDLLKEYSSNNKDLVSEVLPHSDKKVLWHCQKCGNIWRSKIDSRTRLHCGCPKCGINKVATSKFKPVINVDTGNKYTSLKMAEKETGINKMCISNVCRGKQTTAGGYHWKFLNN